LSLLQKEHLLVSGPILTLFLPGTLDRKHPSKIIADVFVGILPANNFIAKAVNIFAVDWSLILSR
jgi:hypothetical protein